MELKLKDIEGPGKELFRRQAVDAAYQRYGAPVHAPGVGMWVAASFTVSLLVSAMFFLLTTSFPRKETATGSLVPSTGLLSIASQRAGVVSKVFVEEGDYVRRGDPIVRMSIDSVTSGGAHTGKALADVAEGQSSALRDRAQAVDSSLLSQEQGTLARMRGLEMQIQTLRGSVKLYETQAILAEQTLGDLENLVAQQMVSRLQYREAQVQALSARQNVSDIIARIASLEYERQAAQHEVARLESERSANFSSMASESFSIEEKVITYKAQSEIDLISLHDGQITSLRVKAGGAVAAGKTVGVLVPTGSSLMAEIWVPSTAIAFVRPGTRVRLMYDAFPYQKFGVAQAKVVKIARSPTAPEELPPELQAKEGRYRVLIALESQKIDAYGDSIPLTVGMRLSADLILESRSLLDWILDPVLAAKRRHE